MNRWWLLCGAIVTEVTGTLALRGALDRPWLYAVTVVGYAASFFLLVKVLQAGMPLGVAYGVWSAMGVAATAVFSSALFDERFTLPMVGGLVLIIGGVVLVEVGRPRPRGAGLMDWTYLGAAILLEVVSTLALRVAAAGRRRWYAAVVVGYLASFVLLSLALDAGMGIGVAYGIWTAVGVALTAVLSKVLFDEPLTRTMVLGIVLIITGVVLLELGQH